MEALGHVCMYLDGTNGSAYEGLEGALLEEVGHIYDSKRVSKVRLIGTKLKHSLLVADNGIRCLGHCIPLGSELFKGSGKHFLSYPEDILLGGKAHFEIQLIEFSRRTVCSGILIAEAGGNLEILIKAGYHQQLLILLGCLGQCIKFSLIFSGGNYIISCTLGRGSTENGRLDLQKAHLRHLLTKEADDLGTEDNIVLHLAVSQIQVTVFQTNILTDFLGGLNFKGKLMIHLSQGIDYGSLQLNGSGRNLRVVGLLISLFHRSGNGKAHFLGNALQKLRLTDYHLQYAIHITQVNKGHSAMVADVLYPSCHLKGLSDMLFPNLVQL